MVGEEAGGGGDVGVETIELPGGRRARVVHAATDSPAGEVARALRIDSPRGVVVLNGTTSDSGGGVDVRLRQLLVDGVAAAVNDGRVCTITGGTDSGIFASFGAGLGRSAVCLGVAPSARVTWPGRKGAAPGAVPLEPHHSHFVLVDGSEWGDETPMMLELARTLAGDGPSLAVLAGGGPLAHRELLAHVAAGRKVIVLEGSGRVADAVASAVTTGAGFDQEVLAAASAGRVTVFGAGRGAAELRELITSGVGASRRRIVSAPALLKRFPKPRPPRAVDYPLVEPEVRASAALLEPDFAHLDSELVPRFRAFDREAQRAQHAFRLGGVILIVGGAVSTTLGAVQSALNGGNLAIGIAEAVVSAVVAGAVVYVRGRRFQQTYLSKRLIAERIKSQYYLYLARAGPYAVADDGERRRQLDRTLAELESGDGSE